MKAQHYGPLMIAASNTMSNVIQKYSNSISSCISYYTRAENYKKNKRPIPPSLQNYIASCDRNYPRLRRYIKQNRSRAFMKVIEQIPEYRKAKKEYNRYNRELQALTKKLRKLNTEMQLLQMELDDIQLQKLK